MEPSQQTPSSVRGMPAKPVHQRANARPDNMNEKKSLVTMPNTVSSFFLIFFL
ncbi:unnamed protein product [Haemonchus placei]|uniref:Uncharacterized protein n=1 Tax=Haemonchus placei TaxID=6290 RepID=A0A0N4WUZ5_HAEPC|nr:unnamed protein product [Haemonchus placei]